jgi:hypothetical protein
MDPTVQTLMSANCLATIVNKTATILKVPLAVSVMKVTVLTQIIKTALILMNVLHTMEDVTTIVQTILEALSAPADLVF